MDISKVDISKLLGELNAIGIALSAEKDHDRLMEMILVRAKEITNADGGTLYTRTEEGSLRFEIMRTDSLGIIKGGKSGEPIELPPIRLYNDDGEANVHNVAACAAISGKTFNIVDAYSDQNFDFSGTRKFDEKTGYRSTSFLTVPMADHENTIIGVLQLINAIDEKTGEVKAFTELDQQLVESLASQAAVAISNKNLIEAQRQLFDALIKLIANAIDEKSPYTAGHCRRVPVLTNMLADAASNIKTGPLKDFSMTEEEKYELEVAAWLHDCGKITTPEYVVDKSTKLETIFDRIELVKLRYEVLMRDAGIEALKRQLKQNDVNLEDDDEYVQTMQQLRDDLAFIDKCNIGGEFLSDEDQKRIDEIGNTIVKYYIEGEKPLLSDEEIQNLQISRGTLSIREREIINNHVTVTIKMLESLPYPKHLRRVPEYAGGHHEKLDGTGYPNKLTAEQMSIPARMVAIADIFEALTAADRPYKKAMPLSLALTILGRMKEDNHIDPDLFDVFIHDKLYLKYADGYLAKEQIDEVDISSIPGYNPL
ncbi:MAG: HD domain-containing phosphohydrolase [Gammaproteobacteria bacterium]|nr:HD domain-containing phosphohydrolase [Gammaproteobacteria bacterium]